MGYAVLGSKSIQQLQRHIRAVAADTSSIVLLPHAKQRMRLRKVNINEVIEVLRRGSLIRTPEPNPAKGSLECRMQRYLTGGECAVVVAICDEQPDLLVVTVMTL
jgi:hypothetical protein